MSSIHTNNPQNYGPDNAVNGQDRPETRTAFETPEERRDPWWYVYLGGMRRITKIRITNNNYRKLTTYAQHTPTKSLTA